MGKTKENNANIIDRSKKKLLITGSTFPRWENDTEPRFIFDYAEAMTAYYDVTVLVPAAPGAKDVEKMSNVNVVRYHYFPIQKWETLCYPGAIVPRIKKKKIRILLVPFLFLSLYVCLKKMLPEYDIVHAHWLIPQGIVQSFFKDKPYIITGHGGDISSLNNGIFKRLKEKCLCRAGAITVVSEFKQRELNQYYPGHESKILSMGVNTLLFDRKINYSSNYFNQGNRKVILYVGRLAEIKGVEYLIQAMQYIGNAILVIVGDGPEKGHLEELAKTCNVDAKFLGSKSHEELKIIYASADVLVVPSIIDHKGAQEGLPTVILEAMASKLPVIATKTGGIPQLIQDGVNGLLCDEKCVWQLSDHICSLLDDKNLYNEIVNNGYQTVKKYDYSNIAEEYYKILEDVSLESVAVRNFET